MRIVILLLTLVQMAFANQSIFELIKKGSVEEVEEFLTNTPIAINDLDENGNSPIMVATKLKSLPIVNVLLDFNPDLSIINNDQKDIYLIATDKKSFDKNLLLELPFPQSINSDFLGNSAFHKLIEICEEVTTTTYLNQINNTELVNANNQTLLIYSAINNCNTSLATLINLEANVNAKDTNNIDAITYTFNNNNLKGFELLIKAGAIQPNSATELFTAIEENDSQTLKKLLETGIDVNSRSEDGTTALMISAQDIEKLNISKILIEFGANLELVNSENNNVLHIIAQNNNIALANIVIDEIKDLNVMNNDNQSALDIANDNGNRDIVKMLIDKGAKNTILAYNLMSAVESNDYVLTYTLLKQNVYTEYKDYYNRTPLTAALRSSYYEIAELLINYGADINNKDSYSNKYPADYLDIDHPLFIKLLDLGGKTDKANELVMKALVERNSELYKKYIKNISDINYRTFDYEYTTFLIEAVKIKDLELTEEILKMSPDFGLYGNDSLTAMQIAFNQKSFDIIELLLKYEAPFNNVGFDENNETILTAVLKNGNIKLFTKLVEANADIMLYDDENDKFNILHLVINTNNEEAFNIIKNHPDFSELVRSFEDSYNRRTPFYYHSMMNDNFMLRELLELSEYINYSVNDKKILQIALDSKNSEAYKLLKEFGNNQSISLKSYLENNNYSFLDWAFELDADLLNNKEDRPLFYAVENNNIEMTSYLVNKGAEVNFTFYSRSGVNTSPILMTVKNKNKELFNILKEKGITEENMANSYFIDEFAAADEVYFFEELLKKGLQLKNALDRLTQKNAVTILGFYLESNQFELSKDLVKLAFKLDNDTFELFYNLKSSEFDFAFEDNYNKSNLFHIEGSLRNIIFLDAKMPNLINKLDRSGRTALMASIDRYGDYWKKLLKAKSLNINQINQQKKNVLFYISHSTKIDTLIKAGANINQRDVDGNNLVQFNLERSNFYTAFDLILRGADINTKNNLGANTLDTLKAVKKHSSVNKKVYKELKKLIKRAMK